MLDLNLMADDTQLTLIDSFDVPSSPSGLFAHAENGLYILTIGGGRNGAQRLYQYTLDGDLTCQINIPTELGMVRPDGVFFDADDEFIYLADSQGPIFGGASLYKIAWTNPC